MERLVSVVIPTFNRPNELTELVDSVFYVNRYKNIEIIIVDNNSTVIDYSAFLDRYNRLGMKIKLLVNTQVSALSRSRNMGLVEAKGDFIFFIDDDNVLEEDTIGKLVEVFDSNNSAGVVSAVAFYYGQKDKVLDAGAIRNYLNSFTINLFLNEDRPCLPQDPFEVSEVSNAFMIKRDVFKRIGIFDEANFPIDLDEADLCVRARSAYRIFAAPGANVYHKVYKINSLAITSLRFRREKNAYFMGRNRIFFQRKHLSKINYFIFLFLYFPVFFYLYIFSSLFPQPETNFRLRIKFIMRFLEGIGDGLLNKPNTAEVIYA